MLYFETKPSDRLAPFIECFWTLEAEANAESYEPERMLPDGCVELILNFGSRFREHKSNGQHEQQPRNLVVGQMSQPILIAPTGSVELLGVRFHPSGVFPFFQVPMHELTNRVVDLGMLSSKFERDLLDSIGQVRSSLQRIAVIELFLIERLRGARTSSRLSLLAGKIVQRGGQVAVDELANDAGISCRQLERRFLREVGIGPKLLCRILRFQQVFRAVDRNDDGWAAVASDCGYFDQAHLIRDFNQFAGQPPAALFDRRSTLMESFTRKNRMSDFSNNAA